MGFSQTEHIDRCSTTAITVACLLVTIGCSRIAQQAAVPQRVLRVCSDPNNLPFSNDRGEGFENRLAELIARELNARLEYTWFAQRRGFIRNTLQAGLCDVVLGIPAGFELVTTTRTYYRSTYVFVTRKNSRFRVKSMNDEVLRHATIGVHVIGDDYTNPPPLHALGRRNIVHNVTGYRIYGNYAEPNPPARLLEAVTKDEVDIAIIWGPFAGYFARQQATPLTITPVLPEIDLPFLPFVYDIAMGVRRGDEGLRQDLERVLERRGSDINNILTEYGVPLKATPQD